MANRERRVAKPKRRIVRTWACKPGGIAPQGCGVFGAWVCSANVPVKRWCERVATQIVLYRPGGYEGRCSSHVPRERRPRRGK